MVPWVTGHGDAIHATDFVEGWAMCDRAAVRKGNWKAVYLPSTAAGPSPKGNVRLELFDIGKDKGEIYDQSAEQPNILRELLQMWDRYVVEAGVAPLNCAWGVHRHDGSADAR